VKIYGNRPRKLLNRISENNDTNKNVLPLLIFFNPKSVLNSLLNIKLPKAREAEMCVREGAASAARPRMLTASRKHWLQLLHKSKIRNKIISIKTYVTRHMEMFRNDCIWSSNNKASRF
jgi:hypothetical protein